MGGPFAPDPFPSTYAPLPRVTTLIVGATVLDGAGARLEQTSLLIREGRIAAIGSALDAPADATVIDAQARWVTPGIIDPHSHDGNFPSPITSDDFVHSDVSEITDPNTAQVRAEHSINPQDPGFYRALAAGVTTLLILPGSQNLIGGRGVIVKPVPAVTVQAMKFPQAPAGLKMACGENPKSYYGDQGRFPSSRMGNVAGFRQAFTEAAQYLAKWQAYRADPTIEPPAVDLKLDALAQVLLGELRVHVHCYRADEMAYMLDVAREFGFRITAFHHAVEAYKIAGLLAEAQTCATVWSDWWGYKLEASDAIRANAAFVDAAGACVSLHSDSASVGQRLVIEAAKAMAAGRRAGLSLTPEHAIAWVTSDPARELGLEDRIGTLAVDMNADLVIWSGDPFSIYTQADQVFIDGARVYDRFDAARQPRSDFELGQPSQEMR